MHAISDQTDVDQLRWQSLQCSWTSSQEQSADGPQTAGLVTQPLQKFQWDQSSVW